MPDKKKKLPDLYLIFDERSEFHAHITHNAISVKKGEQHDSIMEFAGKLGTPQKLANTTLIGDTNLETTKSAFEEAGYTVVQATEQDFSELQRELDKILSIKGGESKKYGTEYRREHR